jgi:peptidoglycan/xylan/chitin deacetylase (PgdA/CDA1 family)
MSERRRDSAHRDRDVLVLCYHGVHPAAEHGEVTPREFREQLRYIASRGYRWATFAEAVLGDARGRVAAVTFDDGIGSALEHGLPVLEELGAAATMFPRLDTLDVPGRLDADDIRGLAERGWEVGSHTLTHPVLTEVDDAVLHAELAGSRARIEQLTGQPCASVAYPTGRADARVVAAAAAAGYTAGAALEGAVDVPPGPLCWPRVGVRGDDSPRVFRLKCSPSVRRLRSSRLRRPIGAVASAAGRVRRRV